MAESKLTKLETKTSEQKTKFVEKKLNPPAIHQSKPIIGADSA